MWIILYHNLHWIPHNFCIKHFLFRRKEKWENIHWKLQNFLSLVDEILCMRADIRIYSSHDCLAHTLAPLPDPRKSKSDLISPKLAHYDFL